MIDPVLAYVAVVTTAIVLPLGVYLGALRERARAAHRCPRPAHEVLADEAIVLGLRGALPKAPGRCVTGYCINCHGEVWAGEWGDFLRMLCRRCVPSRPDPSLTERVPRGRA